MEIIWLALIGTPFSACLAWWFWSKRGWSQPHILRTRLMLMGLVTASMNALIYYAWLLYRLINGGHSSVWMLKTSLADIGMCLVVLALAGAILAKAVHVFQSRSALCWGS